MQILWTLYRAFFMIGALTFGGGYAMLPMLEREIVAKHKWATQEEILDYFAIGQCTPGIIAVNTATFVGYKQKGIIGGIVATLGVVSPSIVIIMVIAAVLTNFMDVVWVQHAFAGIRVAVCALIVASVIKLAKSNVKAWTGRRTENCRARVCAACIWKGRLSIRSAGARWRANTSLRRRRETFRRSSVSMRRSFAP